MDPVLNLPTIELAGPIQEMSGWFVDLVSTNAGVILGAGVAIYAAQWGLRKGFSLIRSAVR